LAFVITVTEDDELFISVDCVPELRPLFIPEKINDCGEPWWNDVDREELGEKPVEVSLCPPQIPHGLTRASAVRDRLLTA
jgi:hypothetical protein